jgi:hypothetical protein
MIHQQSIQRTNSNKAIKTSIIKQTQNFTTQHTVKGTMLNVVIKVRGILLSLVTASDFNFLCKDLLLQSLRIDELVAPFFR